MKITWEDIDNSLKLLNNFVFFISFLKLFFEKLENQKKLILV